MKLLVVSALLVLLAVCSVSAQGDESILSSSISYVKDLASDVANKATGALNQVKELPIAQQAMEIYDAGADYVTSFYSSVLDIASEKWGQLTKAF